MNHMSNPGEQACDLPIDSRTTEKGSGGALIGSPISVCCVLANVDLTVSQNRQNPAAHMLSTLTKMCAGIRV